MTRDCLERRDVWRGENEEVWETGKADDVCKWKVARKDAMAGWDRGLKDCK